MSGNRRNEIVVVLHGIGMNTLRMAYISHRLRRAGYTVLNTGYKSTRRNIENAAQDVAKNLQQYAHSDHDKIHFVGHSMGCLVALQLLAWNETGKDGRAVFIAPPYQGSQVADMLQHWRLYKHFFGPAGQQLTTGYRKDVSYSLPPSVEFGIISGTRAWEYPLFLSTMGQYGVHDGLVSLNSTRIPGSKDHITLRCSHSFLLESSPREVLHFLEQGRFSERATRPFSPSPSA